MRDLFPSEAARGEIRAEYRIHFYKFEIFPCISLV
jgi:hypothetical protein